MMSMGLPAEGCSWIIGELGRQDIERGSCSTKSGLPYRNLGHFELTSPDSRPFVSRSPAYAIYSWGTKRNHYLNSKAGLLEFGDSEE